MCGLKMLNKVLDLNTWLVYTIQPKLARQENRDCFNSWIRHVDTQISSLRHIYLVINVFDSFSLWFIALFARYVIFDMFFRGCVPEVVVPAYAFGLIYKSRESWVVFVILPCSLCLHILLPHYHHYADVSEGVEFLKCFSRTFVECVFKIKSVLSIIFHATHGSVCVRLTISLMVILWEKSAHELNVVIKSEVWPFCHCLRFGYETMTCAVCLSIFWHIKLQITIDTLFTNLQLHTNSLRLRNIPQWHDDCSHSAWWQHC